MLELLLELLWSKTFSAPSFGRYWKWRIRSPYYFQYDLGGSWKLLTITDYVYHLTLINHKSLIWATTRYSFLKPWTAKTLNVTKRYTKTKNNVYLLVCHVPFLGKGAVRILHLARNHLADQQIYFSGWTRFVHTCLGLICQFRIIFRFALLPEVQCTKRATWKFCKRSWFFYFGF